MAYWKEKGWTDRSRYYYTDAKINPVTKALAHVAVASIWPTSENAVRRGW